MLLASNWRDQSRTAKRKLRALCGGEPLPPDLVSELLPSVAELWNMFGPTETTVWSTCKRITYSDQLITVGKPIANTQVYIFIRYMTFVTNERPFPFNGLTKSMSKFGR